jgi:hypothetical protein
VPRDAKWGAVVARQPMNLPAGRFSLSETFEVGGRGGSGFSPPHVTQMIPIERMEVKKKKV